MYYTVPHNILDKTNSFLMAKAEIILFFVKLISKKQIPYTNVFNKRDLASIDKAAKMISQNKNRKMPNIRYIPSKNKYTIFNRSGSGI